LLPAERVEDEGAEVVTDAAAGLSGGVPPTPG